MRNEHFCDFEQKYTPETITFIRFWATFPQAWFFIMISFCRKKIFSAEFYFHARFFYFLEISCFYEKKHLKKAYLFLGLEHDPSPFRRQEHIGNVIFRILLQKWKWSHFGSQIAKSSKFLTFGAKMSFVLQSDDFWSFCGLGTRMGFLTFWSNTRKYTF